ncbi:MAG: segregation/condensation protein A [Nitrospirae bacterium]|nr:segregation/condensation protein A [Nitrospirota bacterium]MBF0541162.1 segregation/condensation protein A [Nitrospirota bacterium]
MKESYEIKIPVFSGPLDLLLSLINENEIDIYDIPIAFITSQYLQYLDLMKELNLEIAGEYILMASTLIYIKSKTMIPIEEQSEDDEEIDPRLELVEQLIEYQTFKETALALKERQEQFSDIFYRGPQEIVDTQKTLIDITIYDLISAFASVLKDSNQKSGYINRETLTVKDMISMIMQRLEEEIRLDFLSLFEENSTRIEKIVTFLALLEILKLGNVSVLQEIIFGNIVIIKKRAKE